MSYLHLDEQRLLTIVDGLNSIAAAAPDVDEVAEVAVRVARVVSGASGAGLEVDAAPVGRYSEGTLEGKSVLSLPLLHDGQVGILTVAKADEEGFDQTDIEALRLVTTGMAAQLSNSIAFAEIARESRVDSLTGLGNRLSFDERLGWELSRASRYGEDLSLVLFDVDGFGALNDRFGPEVGDEILTEIAAALGQARQADSVFRIGGDEFAVIMPNTAKEGAEIAAIRLGWGVLKTRDGQVTVSSGVAQADIPDPRLFFSAAESALRSSKETLASIGQAQAV